MTAWKEQLGALLRYCLVGVINTLAHVTIVVIMVEWIGARPPPANAFAFLIANIGSYAMNSRWTFGAPMSINRYARFLMISLVGLAITYGCSSVAMRFQLHYLVGVALSVALVTLTGFILGRLFVFRH